MEYSRWLVELRRGDEPRFGGKSAGLGELLAARISVPPGFALSGDTSRMFVERSGLSGAIEEGVRRLAPGDVEAIAAASGEISHALRSAPVPGPVRDELACRYEELGAQRPVAVRSSAIGEDSRESTFAGQQETYLWVRGTEQVCDAVRDCWVSLYSAPAISYRLDLGAGALAAPDMGVAVQRMVDAVVSGVMFTCNPVSGDPSMVAINASWGLGLAVVGGEVTPDDFLVSKVTGEIVREHVHPKPVEYVPDSSGQGAVRIGVAEDRRHEPSLDADTVPRLVETARRVERHFGSHQDIEWAIDRGDELFVLQSRPVTVLPGRDRKAMPSDALSMVMRKFGAGPDDAAQ